MYLLRMIIETHRRILQYKNDGEPKFGKKLYEIANKMVTKMCKSVIYFAKFA